MTRESFEISLSRLAALVFALMAALALALALAPGTALAATGGSDIELAVGESKTLQPSDYGLPADATVDSFGVETSPSGYAKADWDSGHVVSITGREAGTTTLTITATYNNNQSLTKSYSVSVSGSSAPTAVIDPTGAGTVSSTLEEGNAARYTATANDGWDFTGWTITWNNGRVDEESQNPTYGLDLAGLTGITAHFKEKEAPATTYKITVTDDGNGTAEASVAEAAAGTKVQLTATPKDRSYVFDKWVSDDVTVEGDAFEMPAKNVTVKATFKKAEPVTTYAITFDANGGTGTMDKQTVEAGATATLTANAFTRDGYTFAGWNTAKDGGGTAYADKAEVKVEGDMTLYAQWKANSSKSTGKVAKTGDATLPLTAAVAMAAALAAGVLLVARRRMG